MSRELTEYDTKESLMTSYIKDVEKYQRLSHKRLLEEYENINKRKYINIMTGNVLDSEKLFSLISSKSDYILVANYIKENCINKYPQTKVDKELILKLENYNHKYNKKKTNLKQQLTMYENYIKSKETVINANLKLVVSIANKYSKFYELMDLISIGNEALILAVDRYDSTSNNQFSTFATYYIRGIILRTINNTVNIVRIPVSVISDNLQLSKEISKLKKEKGNLSNSEIVKELGITDKRLETYYNYKKVINMASTNKELSECGDTVETYLEDENDPYDEINNCSDQIVEEILSTLSERERYILERRIGINAEKMTLIKLAEELHITHQAVRSTEAKSLKKLRSVTPSIINR